MKRTLFIIMALALVVVMVMAPAVAADDTPIIYGTERASGEIYEIDPTTGAATLVFTADVPPVRSSSPGSPNGLAYDTANGWWYYTEYQGTGDATAELYFHDGTTQKFAGTLTGAVPCADFYGDKYYYIAGNPTDDLYEVTFNLDGTVASCTKVGDISANIHRWTFGGDIAISADGVIYGFGDCGVSGHPYEFFKVNLDGTGFQMIKSGGYAFSLQLAFGADGILYGHASTGDGLFYATDLGTGALSAAYPNLSKYLYTDLSTGPRASTEELYSICGYKFADWDDAYIPLPGWNITLQKVSYNETSQKWDADPGFEAQTATTDGEGKYCFTELVAGNYSVSETLKEGWTQLSPDGSGDWIVELPGEAYDADAEYNFVNTPALVGCYDETAWAYGGGTVASPNNGVEGNPSSAWGWTNNITANITMDLYAAAGQNDLSKGFKAGTVTVAYNGTCVTVTYELDEGYTLGEAHLWIGATPLPLVPAGKAKTPTPTAAPGQFPYDPEIAEDGSSATFELCDVDGPFYVAAHAVVEWCEYDEGALEEIEAALGGE